MLKLSHDTNLTDVLINIEEKQFIYAFSYLIQLTEENISRDKKSDLIWFLTRQLLIAHYMKHDEKESIPKNVLTSRLKKLKENEIINEILLMNTVSEKMLLHIIENEELELLWLEKTSLKIKQSLKKNRDKIQKDYESSDELNQTNVYEVYECFFNTLPEEDPESLEELSQCDILKMKLLGGFTEDQLLETLQIQNVSKEGLPVFIANPTDKPSYFIANFHLEYKTPYKAVETNLLEFYTHQELEAIWDEFANDLLSLAKINYNEKNLQKLMES